MRRPGREACLAGSRHREEANGAGGWQGARKGRAGRYEVGP